MNRSTYAYADDSRCNVTTYIKTFEMDAPWSEHGCVDKCSEGCSGPDCHCDLAAVDDLGKYRLCLPVEECRRACEAHADCDGFDVIESGCILTTSCSTVEEE